MRVFLSRLIGAFRRGDGDLNEEIQTHLDLLTAQNIDAGMDPDRARRAALRAFGGTAQTKDACRDQRGLPLLDSIWQDLRLATRLLVKDRAFAVAAVSALALGISANTTMFTAVNAGLIRDLPFLNPDRIVSLGTRDARVPATPGPPGYRGVSFLEFQDWKRAATSFSGMSAYYQTTMNVGDDVYAPERFTGAYVSGDTLRLIGIEPALGRGFSEADDQPGAQAVVILGDRVWRARYMADPAVIGRTIRINGVPSTIVGIMSERFQFPANAELWQPLTVNPGLRAPVRGTRLLNLVGRLAEGTTLPQAQAGLDAIAAQMARDFPASNTGIVPTVTPYADRFVAPQVKFVFLALMGAVGVVLLIACANVANLLLVRSTARASEVSIRVSLGATRSRIVRQLLIESLLLAAVAGLVGLALSLVGLSAFRTLIESLGAPPYWVQFTMDQRVFAFFAAVCLGTTVLFGLAPALYISKTNVNVTLREGARMGTGGVRARKWTGALVVGQLSLTMVLLASAGYFGRSFLDVYRVDLGFDTSGLIRMALVLPTAKYPTPEKRSTLARELDSRLRAIPQIAASVTNAPPFGGGDAFDIAIDGQRQPGIDGGPRTVVVKTIGPDYFQTLGLQLSSGRPFDDRDGAPGREAAIVNQRFATIFFPHANPLGERFTLMRTNAKDTTPQLLTVVGVAPNVYQRNASVPDAVVHVPYLAQQLHYSNLNVFVRSDARMEGVISRIREEVRALDPDLPVFDVSTFDQWLAFLRSPERVFSALFGMFACMALLLAAVGVYGVVAHSVKERTREIGIRLALGAHLFHIRWLVMRRGLTQLAAGVAIGLAGALGAGRAMSGVWATANDPAALFVVTAVLAVVMLWACFWPARRATLLNPAAALRHE